MTLEWLIIGGGVQGSTIATYLLRKNKASADMIRIVDPHEQPLSVWKRCTSTIEMPYLRSPSVHHLDVEPFALEKFAKSFRGKSPNFTTSFDRPSLELFHQHCDTIFEELHFEKVWIQERVIGLQKWKGNWKVALSCGEELVAKRVVLAMGLSEQPFWPEWAVSLSQNQSNIQHIFDPLVGNEEIKGTPPFAIVGGGISAAHTSLALSSRFPGQVTLITRHPLRVHQFDSDPGWLGPKNMSRFTKLRDYDKRRQMIQEARYRGSMPKELYLRLHSAQRKGDLTIVESEVLEGIKESGYIKLTLTDGHHIQATNILLATGFRSTLPGIDWLTSTIEIEKLPCARCGYPILLPKTLEWTSHLFVMGALAELEIGPVSRNIAGARRGAERILHALA